MQTKGAVVLVSGTFLLALAFRRPVEALAFLIFLTAVVPYGVQNQFGIGSGAGLLLSDVLLGIGLAVAVPRLFELSLSRRELVLCALVTAILAIAFMEFVRGVRLGHGLSQPGFELRTIAGLATALLTLPVLADPRARRRFLGLLLVVAIALGAWGFAQWFGHIQFSAGDIGVRPGVRLTSAGKGQLQGGEFGYPVAVVMCYAVLLGGAVRRRRVRAGLILALVLNAVSLLLTFERTFWVAAVAGILVVTARATSKQRLKALLVLPPLVLVSFAALALLLPAELTTARQRLESVGQYGTDKSVRYRVVESQHVVERIRAHPLSGSGLGASIYWGQPWSQVAPTAQTFTHDAYLWLGWKLGLVGAALVVALLATAILSRGPPRDDELRRSVRSGAQGALLTLAIISVTFSTFAELSATAVMGVLLSLALARVG
jgi:energy-coupling factor transporter transmembrane protein EcfT